MIFLLNMKWGFRSLGVQAPLEVPPLALLAGSLKALVDFFESMAKLRMHTEVPLGGRETCPKW